MSLESQLSLNQNGGVYYEGTRVTPTDDPILFVGLGGTGIDALLRVKNEVQSRMPLPKGDNGQLLATSPLNIAFLALDTDQETFMKTHGIASFDKAGDETLKLFVDGLPQVIASVVQKDLDKEEWNWYDPELTANGGLDGANGIRQIGRFMLFQRINDVCARFKIAIERVLRAAKTNSLKIFITTGIGGGTGSGTFLDVAYILRDLALAMTPNVQVHGYIFTPDLNKRIGGDDTSLYRNGFASLKELDYWMSCAEHKQQFVQRYNNSYIVKSLNKPFDFCHIITAQDANHNIVTYKEAMDSVGSNLFSYIVSEQVSGDGNTALKEMYDNIAGHVVVADKPYPANYNYLSVGSDVLEIPYTEITTLVAARVFEKLTPVFNREPDRDTFNMDMRNLELTPDHLWGYIHKDVMASPLQTKSFSYGDIWPSNAPFAMSNQWLIHAQQVMRKNRSNLSGVREGTFREYMYRLIKSAERGPCYAARLIHSNTGYSLIKTLEGFKEDCRERMTTASSRAGALKNTLQQVWAAGQGVGMLGRRNATEDYMQALKAWLDNEYGYWAYFELVDGLDEFIERLKRYYDRVFKTLKDALCSLPEIFQQNVNKLKIDEAEAQKHPENYVRYLIRPLQFELKFSKALTSKVETGTEVFLRGVSENIKKWVGIELEEIDSDILDSTDISGCIARFINENFSETLTMNMEMLLLDKLAAGENPDDLIRRNLDSLRDNAIPMYHMDVAFGGLNVNAFSLISVPNDCPRIFAVANRPGKPTGDRPKLSSERSKLQWVKVMAGMPLYAFPEVSNMEKAYEYAMTTKATRKGVHLRWEWREQLPSPLPETTWQNEVVNEPEKGYSKKYNQTIREAFDKCLAADIIRMAPDGATARLYIADASKLETLELHGTLQEKKEQLDLLRRNLWNDNVESIQLHPLGSAISSEIMPRIRENVLRFYNISASIKAQADILSKFDAVSDTFKNVEYYIDARFAELIYQSGFDIKFRRSEADYSPIVLFDSMTQTSYLDYDIYKQFSKHLDDEIRGNIKNQFEIARRALLSADGTFNQTAVAAKREALTTLLTRVKEALSNILARIDQTPIQQCGPLVEIRDFYQKADELLIERLRALQ